MVDEATRAHLISTVDDLVAQAVRGRATRGVAVCVSPEHHAVVRLGRPVEASSHEEDTGGVTGIFF